MAESRRDSTESILGKRFVAESLKQMTVEKKDYVFVQLGRSGRENSREKNKKSCGLQVNAGNYLFVLLEGEGIVEALPGGGG